MASPEPAGLLAGRLVEALRASGSFRLISGDRTWDGAALLHQATDFQRWLGKPDRPAARVLIRARNSGGYLIALLGTLIAGGVPMLLDPLTSDTALAELVSSCGVDLVLDDQSATSLPEIGDQRYRARPAGLAPTGHRASAIEHAADVPELAPDTELCRFTSGSTRTAACIEFAGSAVLAAADSWLAASRLMAQDRLLCFAGLYNGLAFNTSLIPGLLAGASLTLPIGLPTGGYVRRQLAACQPTVLVAFPAIYDALAGTGTALTGVARLRLSLSSAARLSPDTARTLAVRDGVRVSDYYGLAETGPVTLDLDPVPDGGQGRPLPRAELRFAERSGYEREVWVRTPSMGTRYLNYPGGFEAKLTSDGYYRSGDEGYLRDGRLYLSGRLGKGININGRKVSADEIRQVLLTHPVVRDCHVLALPDQDGQPVLGALVATTGELTAAELRRHCLHRLAPYQIPNRILFTSAIPRSGSGKPQLARIEQYLAEQLQSAMPGSENQQSVKGTS